MSEKSLKILVAFDDSPSAQKAFDFAIGLAQNCPGGIYSITVLSVVQATDLLDAAVNIEPIIAAAQAKQEAALQALKAKAKALSQDITTDCVVGHPSEAIVNYAQKTGCNMIVIGNRGRSQITEWLLGSVSHQVATHARCTVTIVK